MMRSPSIDHRSDTHGWCWLVAADAGAHAAWFDSEPSAARRPSQTRHPMRARGRAHQRLAPKRPLLALLADLLRSHATAKSP
jgi:hypothetical protein